MFFGGTPDFTALRNKKINLQDSVSMFPVSLYPPNMATILVAIGAYVVAVILFVIAVCLSATGNPEP
jgi:hypothetical protein